MKSPLVSVCLPNLNTFPYLEERVATIFAQTYDNWELVVSDNFSDDGAWPFFEKLARRDARVRISQAPREGLYPNWNNCIRAAQGEYVYIATSDDTMATDCLEKLVGAMESHPECDLAHCQIRRIDQQGRVKDEGVSPKSLFALSSGDLLFQRHIRRAPFDGLLHMLGPIVYFSITQLLIRRSLFSKIGFFESRWGSLGDFNWEMRAGLVSNTIHVPDTWGGFRVHPSQATARVNFTSPEFFTKLEEMIDDALVRSTDLTEVLPSQEKIPGWWRDAQEVRGFLTDMAVRQSSLGRKLHLLGLIARGSAAARKHALARLSGRYVSVYAEPSRVEEWLSALGIDPVLLPVDPM